MLMSIKTIEGIEFYIETGRTKIYEHLWRVAGKIEEGEKAWKQQSGN